MAEICPICGLPKDLCVCEEISKEQQRIRIRLETRKWGKHRRHRPEGGEAEQVGSEAQNSMRMRRDG